jgi:DNA repair protein RecO (recombination protein O)
MKKISDGILVSVRKFGNNDIITSFLTEKFGVINGLIKGGQSKKSKGIYQIGSLFNVEWVGRFEYQLGTIIPNLIQQYYVFILGNHVNLELMSCMCNMLHELVIGEEKAAEIYRHTLLMIKNMCDDSLSKKEVLKKYLLFEKNLMGYLGFGFELDKCNVTGTTEIGELKYISPTTAKAVSNMGAIGYENKLLRMPEFFIIDKNVDNINRFEFEYANNALSYFFDKNLFVNKFDRIVLNARNNLIKRIISEIAN